MAIEFPRVSLVGRGTLTFEGRVPDATDADQFEVLRPRRPGVNLRTLNDRFARASHP